MKIPESIRINGIDYRIELVERLCEGGEALYGDVRHGIAMIRIDAGTDHQRQCVTLWHEAIHTICTMHGIDLGEREEQVASVFSFAIYQILQDNGRKLFDLAVPTNLCGADLHAETQPGGQAK
jgi:hypothetical protein